MDDATFNQDLGCALQAARQELCMTQLGLARSSGHSVATISKYERGLTGGRIGTLRDIARVLCLDLDQLVKERRIAFVPAWWWDFA